MKAPLASSSIRRNFCGAINVFNGGTIRCSQKHRRFVQPEEKNWEVPMDAKYNWIIDNTGIRLALNIAGFAVWLLACAALLSF